MNHLRIACTVSSLLMLAGCISTFKNMDKIARYRAVIVDIDSRESVPDLPLRYIAIRKPYFIVGAVEVSTAYISDSLGAVMVPESEFDSLLPDSHVYQRVPRSRSERRLDRKSRTIWVRRILWADASHAWEQALTP